LKKTAQFISQELRPCTPCVPQVTDLRSSLVREACVLLEAMAIAAGDGMRVLMRDITPVMMQLVGSGNSVSTHIFLLVTLSTAAQCTRITDLRSVSHVFVDTYVVVSSMLTCVRIVSCRGSNNHCLLLHCCCYQRR
jgi:hypothetical protein